MPTVRYIVPFSGVRHSIMVLLHRGNSDGCNALVGLPLRRQARVIRCRFSPMKWGRAGRLLEDPLVPIRPVSRTSKQSTREYLTSCVRLSSRAGVHLPSPRSRLVSCLCTPLPVEVYLWFGVASRRWRPADAFPVVNHVIPTLHLF